MSIFWLKLWMIIAKQFFQRKMPVAFSFKKSQPRFASEKCLHILIGIKRGYTVSGYRMLRNGWTYRMFLIQLVKRSIKSSILQCIYLNDHIPTYKFISCGHIFSPYGFFSNLKAQHPVFYLSRPVPSFSNTFISIIFTFSSIPKKFSNVLRSCFQTTLDWCYKDLWC